MYPKSVLLNKTSADIVVGETLTLTATVSPNNATDKTVTWTSSDESVVTVSEGTVTGLKAGTATITATTVNGLSASCTVSVKEVYPKSVLLNKTSADIVVGETLTLTATVSPNNATDKTIRWTSSDKSVAAVNSEGLVIGEGIGTATITATTVNGLTASCTVNVQIINTEKKYTVTLDGNKVGDYNYLDICTLNTGEEKAFIVDGNVVYKGKSYSFYVGGDTDIITEESTEKAVSEYTGIHLNNYIIHGDRIYLDMLATANIDKGKFLRMGVAFALSEKSEEEIISAVQNVTTGTGTNNKIGVHNSNVNWYNRSGQYQFCYAPYFPKDKVIGKRIYFYTYVVTSDGVKVSSKMMCDINNLLVSIPDESDFTDPNDIGPGKDNVEIKTFY